MMAFLGKFVVGLSRLILLTGFVGLIAAGWLYYGYRKIDCHPVFAKPELDCNILTLWASEHVMIAGRFLVRYNQVLAEAQDFFIPLVIGVAAAALFVVLIDRVLRRRRRRSMGAFADVPGFRPLKDGENVE